MKLTTIRKMAMPGKNVTQGAERKYARPSDSIALALRLRAPIFASDGLLGEGEDGGRGGEGEGPPDDGAADALKRYLEQLDPEDFGKFSP